MDHKARSTEVSQNVLFKQAEAKKIERLALIEPNIVEFSDGFYTYRTRVIVQDPRFLELIDELRKSGSAVNIIPEPVSWLLVIFSWGPTLLFLGVLIYFMRRSSSLGRGAGGYIGFGKSKAKLFSPNDQKITFADVAGVDEAKEELQEIIDFLKDPQKFTRLGGKMPKGVLLIGPPGTGKTLLARAVAGEAGVPFSSISGSDFVEMFVGVGASRVRDLFIESKKNPPCIIFIDELDAVGGHRGVNTHDEKEQTLNQLLVEMDGFDGTQGVIVIAATNRPDTLDPAILRPGRFDRQVIVPKPDIKGREAIIRVHTKKVPLTPDIDFHVLAQKTPGFAGADLGNMVNEATILAAKNGKHAVDESDFDRAIDKVTMGKERKNKDFMSPEEKKNTAYHEAGHALVAILTEGAEIVDKVTIIPRGMALGLTHQIGEDKLSYSESYAKGKLRIIMGGQAAEIVKFGERTSGAGNDISIATDLAQKMIREWGMSEVLGPQNIASSGKLSMKERFLSGGENKSAGTNLENLADSEVNQLLRQSLEDAKELIQTNFAILTEMAQELLVKETLVRKELERYYELVKSK
ncbi:MAG: ATP-dependent zinc metalloprotease FtsH [Candidatus Liptonbacteria bacterium]|nr:ATP-dependent zinc metalloprotease FtsH [Candidatus Liptonbacteria bacterium]